MIKLRTVNKWQVLVWCQRIIGVAVAISYVLAVYSVLQAQVVPDKYLLSILPVTSMVVLLLIYTCFKVTLLLPRTIFTMLLSFIIIAINIYVLMVSSATTGFIRGIQDDNYSYKQYSIVAIKDRHITLTGGATCTTGILQNDTYSDQAFVELQKKTKATRTNYDNLTSLTDGLDKKQVDIAALDSAYIQLLKENYTSFYEKIEVLATFKIKVKNNETSKKTDTTQPFIVYISGIDTYGTIATTSRSDVNILMVIHPKNHKILLVNTPRDYYVQLHGTTGIRDKLTHAGIYGVDMSAKTLEDLYAAPINYYLRINFSSLVNIINVLGGVNVYSDYAFTAQGTTFKQGYNSLSGEQALAFSRERYSFEAGDRTRGQNQQRVIEAIITKLSSPATLLNYSTVLNSLQNTFQTNMSSNDITTLAKKQLDTMGAWHTESISVDGTGSSDQTYSMGGMKLYVMEPNVASVEAAKQKIQQYMK